VKGAFVLNKEVAKKLAQLITGELMPERRAENFAVAFLLFI